jgi:hypothetical protein
MSDHQKGPTTMATVDHPTLADDVSAVLRRAERAASQRAESLSLCGDWHEPDPYTELLEALEAVRMTVADTVQRATFLQGHVHKWGEDERCIHCSADGRA